MKKVYLIYKKIVLKALFLSSFFVFFSVQSEEKPNETKAYSSKVANLVQKEVKKSFTQKYPITYASVESGIYLQQIIANYNLHIKHAINKLLKKELEQGHIYTKELSYLLGQLNTITTVKKAIVVLVRAISAYKSMIQENPSYQSTSDWHENAYSTILLQCSVVLINAAREQLLMILDEIHNSLLYWRDQKEAPIKYFFRKSPLKWFKGKRQADEIATNIRKLEKLEYDIRVILGRLTKHIYDFDINGNNDASYLWINTLLSILEGIIGTHNVTAYENQFEKTAERLRFELSKISYSKDIILSRISFALKPGHITRNWLLYAIAALCAYQASNFYIAQSDFVHESLDRALKSIGETWATATGPLRTTWKDIFERPEIVTPEEENVLAQHAMEIERVLPGLQAKKETLIKALGEGAGFKESAEKELQDLLTSGKHTWNPFGGAWGEDILKDVKAGDLRTLESAVEGLNIYAYPVLKGKLYKILQTLKAAAPLEAIVGIGTDVAQLLPPIASSSHIIVNYLDKLTSQYGKSSELNFKILAFVPASLIGGGMGLLYYLITQRDLSSVRLALLDINSLFIESAAPLNDNDYGKLIYLIQKLKLQAMRYLKLSDMREEFLNDLSKLESNKFNVETKREIIKNMFMKYPFLSIKAKST